MKKVLLLLLMFVGIYVFAGQFGDDTGTSFPITQDTQVDFTTNTYVTKAWANDLNKAVVKVESILLSSITFRGGNVGIGTTNPLAKLAVNYSGASESALILSDDYGPIGLDIKPIVFNNTWCFLLNSSKTAANNTGGLALGVSNEVKFGWGNDGNVCIVPTSGNVGIGVTNPSTKLSVSTTSTSGFSINILGMVDALPTTTYLRGTICYLTSNNQIYISTETVAGIQSWKMW